MQTNNHPSNSHPWAKVRGESRHPWNGWARQEPGKGAPGSRKPVRDPLSAQARLTCSLCQQQAGSLANCLNAHVSSAHTPLVPVTYTFCFNPRNNYRSCHHFHSQRNKL